MKLRDYQLEAERRVYEAWSANARNVCLQLPTGAGKTVIFGKILSDSKDHSIAIAHRSELVSQISLTLARYQIRHNIIAQKPTIRSIVALHMRELNQSYYNPQSKCRVAAVDTLIKLNPADHPWMNLIKLVVQDEGHHPLKNNKWGKAAELFPNARGLYPTATPSRADGCGLGRHADGIMDALVLGPPMRELIERGYLTDYRIINPPSDLDLSEVPISASGDYSPQKLRTAVHKSRITGDVVKHYLRFAAGKLGVTFAVDIESATEIATQFRSAGVAAEVITGETPPLLRASIMQRFRNHEILQLVNVDLLGEGVDVPAISVVSFARPTKSFAVYSQQFGRALRPMPGKDRAIIIDHVGNVAYHGLPDKYRSWSLDRAERKSRSAQTGIIALRTCLNELCFAVYERIYRECPHCGFYTPPTVRSAPEFVDGDLIELSPETLALMRGEIIKVDNTAHPPQHLTGIARLAVIKRHRERQQAQTELRESIALWAGVQRDAGRNDSEIYRLFYFTFGTDILTAQTLGSNHAIDLKNKIDTHSNIN